MSEEARKPLSMQKLWSRGRLLLGLVGLVFVVYTVSEEDALLETLLDVNLLLVIPAVVMIFTATAIKTLRWRVVLNNSQITIPFRRLFGTYLVGTFFSQFMPGASAGGDAMRMVETSADSGRTADSVSSVLVERAIGIATILVSASIILLVAPQDKLYEDAIAVVYLIYGLTFIVATSLIILRMGWFVPLAVRVLDSIRLGKIGDKIQSLSNALQGQLGRTQPVLQMIALSFLANAFSMTASYIILQAFGESVPYFSFIPLIGLTVALEAIPIAPGSLGVREGLYVYFLGFLNVTEGAALGTALILRIIIWTQAGLGGIIFISRAFNQKKDPESSETSPPLSPVQMHVEGQ